jgi:UDP-N-acetylmuramyl pentapeptide synthase
MHCSSSLQAGRRSPKVAVLDTIHGAITIARKMIESGIEAEALEVYHHMPSVAPYDLVVAPVHLGPNNPVLVEARKLKKKIITHHQAVGEILGGNLIPELKVFEVTGTHSKTSTALLLARMLSQEKKILSHTTRGMEIWCHGKANMIQKGLSITPANVIPAMATAESRGIAVIISEISLGGTGLANFGVLTSFSNDYRIANTTKWASTAKLQMISLARKSAKLIANTDARLSLDCSFSMGGQVRAMPDRLIFGNKVVPISLGKELDFPGYQTALAGAAATAHADGMKMDEIAQSLQDFDGFSGRMKIKRQGRLIIFDSSNSGLKVKDVERALDRAKGSGLAVVVGEESETVCEGMNIPGLADLLRQRRLEMAKLILVGERLEPLAKELMADTANNLAEGLETAQREGCERLLSCVKCFR